MTPPSSSRLSRIGHESRVGNPKSRLRNRWRRRGTAWRRYAPLARVSLRHYPHLRAKDMIRVIRGIVDRRIFRLARVRGAVDFQHTNSSRTNFAKHRSGCRGDGNALAGADIRLSANLHRFVFHHDVGFKDGVAGRQIG